MFVVIWKPTLASSRDKFSPAWPRSYSFSRAYTQDIDAIAMFSIAFRRGRAYAVGSFICLSDGDRFRSALPFIFMRHLGIRLHLSMVTSIAPSLPTLKDALSRPCFNIGGSMDVALDADTLLITRWPLPPDVLCHLSLPF